MSQPPIVNPQKRRNGTDTAMARSGELASATVLLSGPARFWCAPAENLKPYVEAHEDIRRAIDHGFATALKAKLRASNRTIAEAGGVAPAI